MLNQIHGCGISGKGFPKVYTCGLAICIVHHEYTDKQLVLYNIMYRQLQTHQALCIGHMILMHLSAIQLTLSHGYYLPKLENLTH